MISSEFFLSRFPVGSSARMMACLLYTSSKKENPNFLFIPTASKDAQAYVKIIDKLYGELGCKTDTLYLSNVEVDKEEVNQKIENADIIYVGSGNTQYMMKIWEEYSVDKALIRAYKSGKVLSGLSAGSICWFIAGHSDSEFIEGVEKPKPIWVKGLGIIPYLHCPHYDEPDRVGSVSYTHLDVYKRQLLIILLLINRKYLLSLWQPLNNLRDIKCQSPQIE